MTATLLAVILLFSCQVEASCDDAVYILLDVSFHSNLMLHKYDVDLYLDGTKKATIPHGERYVNLFEVDPGSHTVLFTKHGNKEISGNMSISAQSDITVGCSITAEKKSITVDSISKKTGVTEAFLVVPDLTYTVLSDALTEMQKRGFINIQSQRKSGGSISSHSNYIIVNQQPSGGSETAKNAAIKLTCESGTDFIMNLVGKKHPQEAESILQQYGFTVSKYESRANGKTVTLKEGGTGLYDNNLWSVSSAFVDGGKKAVITLTFNGEVKMPNIVGKTFPEAKSILTAAEFYDISYHENVWVEKNWTVKKQNVTPGTSVSATTAIVLTLEKK